MGQPSRLEHRDDPFGGEVGRCGGADVPREVNGQRCAEDVARSDHRDPGHDAPRHAGQHPVERRVVEEVAFGTERDHDDRPRPDAPTEVGRLAERITRRLDEIVGADHDRVGLAERTCRVLGERRERQWRHLLTDLQPAQPALDQHDRATWLQPRPQLVDERRGDLVGNRSHQGHGGLRQPTQAIGPDRLGTGLQQEHPSAFAFGVSVRGGRVGVLAGEASHRLEPCEAVARRRLVAGDRQRREGGALGNRGEPRMEDRAPRRDRAVGEAIDGQTADDQRLGHRSIIGSCHSSSTSFTRAPRTS